jgi:hypothetical protein
MSVKVTLNETPPVAMQKSTEAVDIIDSLGRKLKIKEPGILQESRLVRAMGGEASMNNGYMMGYVMPAAMVVEINGDPQPFPATEMQVDAAIQLLGREGLAAVMAHFVEQAAAAKARADALKATVEQERATAIKK